MLKRFAMVVVCASTLAVTGCTHFIASGTGPTPVGTDSGKRSLAQVYIDSNIERTAKINLLKLDTRLKSSSRVNINSFHSHVLLTGQVPDPHLKKLAEDNVRAMSDVKAVHNFITVGEQISYSTIMQDSTVTASTRMALMRAPLISESQVMVHTEDAVLYVMGKLTPEEIQDLNGVLQNITNITRIVTLIDDITQQDTGYGSQRLVPQVQTPVAIDPNDAEPEALN